MRRARSLLLLISLLTSAPSDSSAQRLELEPVALASLEAGSAQWLAALRPVLTPAEAAAAEALRSPAQRAVFESWLWRARASSADGTARALEQKFLSRAAAARALEAQPGDPRHGTLLRFGVPDEVIDWGSCPDLDWDALRPPTELPETRRSDLLEIEPVLLTGQDECSPELHAWRYLDSESLYTGLIDIASINIGSNDAGLPVQEETLHEGQTFVFSGSPSCTALARTVATQDWWRGVLARVQDEACPRQEAELEALGAALRDWRTERPSALATAATSASPPLNSEIAKLLPVTPAVVWEPLGEAVETELDLEVMGRVRRTDVLRSRLHVVIPEAMASEGALEAEVRLFAAGSVLPSKVQTVRQSIAAVPLDERGRRTLSILVTAPRASARLSLLLRTDDGIALGFYDIEPWRGPVETRLAARGTESGVAIVRPSQTFVTGPTEIEARAWGSEVRAVEFLLGNQRAGYDDEAPYEATLPLGPNPLPRTVTAVALGTDGLPLAHDRVVLNDYGSRFQLRIEDLGLTGRTLQPRLSVRVPPGKELERLELLLGGELVATVADPAAVPSIRLERGARDRTSVLTVVGTLTDGSTAETARLVSRSAPVEESLSVDLVELFFTAEVGRKRAASGAQELDLEVLENGVPQTIRSLESTDRLPLRIALVLDASRSLAPSAPFIRRSAARFLDDTLREHDEAAIVSLAVSSKLLSSLSNDPARIRAGLARFRTRKGTALWDAVALTSSYLADREGRSAILVLSDGNDLHSTLGRAEAIAVAQSHGVAVYTLQILARNFRVADPSPFSNYARRERRRRSALQLGAQALAQLAKKTGGASYVIERHEQLDTVYEAIDADLRSQFRLTYQSSNEGDDFRSITLRSPRKDLKLRTQAGYFP